MAKSEQKTASKKRAKSWTQDPSAVKADILKAAQKEFADNGLAGARILDIANRIKTSKRMIFYYFGDKEGLYQAVLENAYKNVRQGERELNLGGLPPLEALRKLVEFTFDHHRDNADFIRLVMIENVHEGKHLRAIDTLARTNTAAIEQLTQICETGKKAGDIREDVSPLILHWQISAMCFFNVSNRPTFSINFGEDLFDEDAQMKLRDEIVIAILNSVKV